MINNSKFTRLSLLNGDAWCIMAVYITPRICRTLDEEECEQLCIDEVNKRTVKAEIVMAILTSIKRLRFEY